MQHVPKTTQCMAEQAQCIADQSNSNCMKHGRQIHVEDTYFALLLVVSQNTLGSGGGNLSNELVHGSHLLLVGHAQDGPLQLLCHQQGCIQLPTAPRPHT